MEQAATAVLRRTVAIVALLNLSYFGIEFAVAIAIGSVALFPDSIDFLTAYTLSAWPDLIVGLAIAAVNADSAREVWNAAHEEHRAAKV
jgi:Co/Zn/Cd efflux system component